MAQDADVSTSQLPLKGVVLCCTSLPQDVRTHLSEIATQMGALHKLDLTSDVSHLVVGGIISPKYQYVAKQRPDIRVLHPDWIEAVRQSWMEGGEVDVKAMEKEHTLPTFFGLQVCVTGFDNHEQRNWISKTVEEQGAVYHGDLTKVVTHLIAAKPEGAKYTHGKQWGVHIVSLKWFTDSLERGMALDEKLYDPLMPIEEQGKDAYRRQRTSLGKRSREGEAQNATTTTEAGKKRLRRTVSTRLESQSQDLWQDMSARDAGGAAATSDGDQWQDEDSHTMSAHVSEMDLKTGDEAARERTTALPSEHTQDLRGLFSGCYILIHGFDPKKTARLYEVLQQNGAVIVQPSDELDNASRHVNFKDRYLVAPHANPDSSITLPDVPATTIVCTEWWVERCIHYKTLLHPSSDPLSTPLWNVHIPALSDTLVSTTGFSGVDLRQVAEAVKLMGATYQEKITPSSSVLVTGSTAIKKEKAYYASKHRIPVVSAEWLWNCLRTKRIAEFGTFEVQLPAVDANEFMREPSTGSPAPSDELRNRDEESIKRKDSSHLKRLSSAWRKRATPSLAFQAAKASPVATVPRRQPIMHDDDTDSILGDSELISASTTAPPSRRASHRSHPLQELSPNCSPRKAGDSLNARIEDTFAKPIKEAKTVSPTVSPAKPASPPQLPPTLDGAPEASHQLPSARPHDELTADLAEIISKQSASRPSSANSKDALKKRKSRPLGRAPSGISNRSMSASASEIQPFDVTEPPPLGTQLGYETVEAEAHRIQMSKRMGKPLQDDVEAGMQRVASLGTVKDSSLGGDVGVGNRVKGRGRTK